MDTYSVNLYYNFTVKAKSNRPPRKTLRRKEFSSVHYDYDDQKLWNTSFQNTEV